MNLKNSAALVGNALNHLELFLRQKSKRKIAASRPPKHTPTPDGFMPLPRIPPQRTLMVIGQATEPSVTRSMSDYTKAMGLPGGYSFYLILSGNIGRIKRELATIKVFLDSYPGTALFLAVGYGSGLTGNIRESLLLLEGRFDPEIDYLCRWLKSLNRAVFLRPLYEFDRLGMTYGGPELFGSAFRYFVDRIRSHSPNNVAFVWHSTGPMWRLVDSSTKYGIIATIGKSGKLTDWYVKKYFVRKVRDSVAISDFYPGDGYADYFAISYWDGMMGLGPLSPMGHSVYMAETRRLFREATSLGLPLIIAESNPAYIGTISGEKSAQWINTWFDLIEEFDIRLASYIAAEFFKEGGVWGSRLFNGFWPQDCRIHADEKIRRLFATRLSSPRYIVQSRESVNEALVFAPSPVPLKDKTPPEPERDRLQWPNCKEGEYPGMGGWCLPKL